MKQLLTFFSIALCATVLGAGDSSNYSSDVSLKGIDTSRGDLTLGRAPRIFGQTDSFIETYDDGTDVGLWHCSVGVPRIIETSGGNPGAYVQQGGFSTSIPTWASISTRFQPGVNDPYKIDTVSTASRASRSLTRPTSP